MTREQMEEITRVLTDSGKLIEVGWVALRHMAIPQDASEVQITEMRRAFFAGAQHVFSSIMNMLEPGAEATEKDLQRISLIDAELSEFVNDLQAAVSRKSSSTSN